MIVLQFQEGSGSARRYRTEKELFSVGPRRGCDIALPVTDGDRAGTDWELRFFRGDDDGDYRVQANVNGILCDGEEVTREGVKVAVGSTIQVGTGVLRVDRVQVEQPAGAAADPDDDTPTRVAEATGPAVSSPAQDRGAYLKLFLQPIAAYLDDDGVSEVMMNGPDQIFIERKGKMELTEARFANDESLQAAMKNVARSVGRRLDAENPRLDARLPDGSRVHAVLSPPSASGTVVAIRKFSSDQLTINRLIEFGSIDDMTGRLLKAVVVLQRNVIVSGPTSSGKTSVLNVLSQCIPDDERILVIEDASELQLNQVHLVRFEARKPDDHGKGEVTIRDLVHSSLRLRPDRLVVGEIRGGEALDLLQALNTGHAGSMSTIHANGPVDALRRLETCAKFSGVDIPISALREQVCSSVNMVVHTARLADHSRKIVNIAEVLPLDKGEYATQDLVRFDIEGQDPDGNLLGRHVAHYRSPSLIKDAEMRGLQDLVEPYLEQLEKNANQQGGRHETAVV
jgi:Flp pilus assembly CpaF family ATPase